jgi:DNA-directed RNA polymerase specialized sigma subunit
MTLIEWDDLAKRAKAGDVEAYNAILVAARSIAKKMAQRYIRRGARADVDDLTHDGIFCRPNGETGKTIGGVDYAIRNWDETGGRGFLNFMRKSIGWAMVGHLRRLPKTLSLDTRVPGDDTEQTFADLLADPCDDGFDYDAASEELQKKLATLTDIERCVIVKMYGLDGAQVAPTLEEVGAEVGRSRETIRKIKIAAELKLGLKG